MGVYTWNCPICTFQQSSLNTECSMCGQKNDSMNNKRKEYGTIVYQTDRFSEDQLTATYTLYLQNSNVKTSKWPLYLFGDNDIDNSRPPNTDREMIGGLGICFISMFE